MSAHKRRDPISRWLVQLRERVGWQKACVAMANKNARIVWAVMTRQDEFDPQHSATSRRQNNPRWRAVPRDAAAAPDPINLD